MKIVTRLTPRQTTIVAVGASVVAASAAVVTFFSTSSFRHIAVWCENFLLMRPADSRAAVLAASTASIIAASIVVTLLAVIRELRAAHTLRCEIMRSALPLPGRVAAALVAIDAEEMPTIVVADARRFAYTFGALRPRVVLSSGMLSALSLEELKAVLRHERCHFLARDPLKSFFWETVCRAFFFFPVIRDVADHLVLARELEADRAAVQGYAGTRTLASALLKTASFTPIAPRAALASFGHLRSRIDALAGHGCRATLTLGVQRILFSSAALLAILGAAAMPVRAATGNGSAMLCGEAIKHEVHVMFFSPYQFGKPIGPSSTENDVQSKEIGP